VTDICLLILRCFFPGCTLLARLNAAHLLRPKGNFKEFQRIQKISENFRKFQKTLESVYLRST
jgi:hypothetical protein